MDDMFIPAFFAVGIGAITSSLILLIRVIPRMARRSKWYTSFLWLFVVGLGSLGVAIVFEILDYPSGRFFFLIADGALVLGAFGLISMWKEQEIRRKKEREIMRKKERENEDN